MAAGSGREPADLVPSTFKLEKPPRVLRASVAKAGAALNNPLLRRNGDVAFEIYAVADMIGPSVYRQATLVACNAILPGRWRYLRVCGYKWKLSEILQLLRAAERIL